MPPLLSRPWLSSRLHHYLAAPWTALPGSCLLCEAACPATVALCPGCLADLPWNHQACRRCALPLGDDRGPQPLCSQCQQQPPLQTQALAPLCYAFPVDHLVAGLKYHQQLAHAPLLGRLLLQAVIAAQRPRPDLLLPVPLHPRRLAARGYNQAAEIARPLARHFGLPLEHRLLRRHKHTAAQMQLDAQQRARNPAQAFAVNRARLADLGPAPRIAIIDDVMTTGATLQAVCAALQAVGLTELELWVVARTP